MEPRETAAIFFLLILLTWVVAYGTYKLLKVKSERLVLGPFYLLLKFKAPEITVAKSKRMDALLSLGTAIALSLLIYALSFSVNNLALFLTRPKQSTQLTLILPGVTFPVDVFIMMIPSFAVVLIVHELAHFIAMRFYGVRTTSVGLFIFFALFGAFVEPDEKQFKSEPPKVRSNVVAAGSVANAALAAIAPLTLMYLPLPLPIALFLLFTAWLSMSVAVINMLPITHLDGSELATSLLEEFGIRSGRLRDVLSLFSILVLALNIVLSWMGPR